MTRFTFYLGLTSLALFLASTSLSLYQTIHGSGYLYQEFYEQSCPKAQEIVKHIVAKAVVKEPRMAASLLRLHFQDCFVKGCDASILLDSSGSIMTEKISNSNWKSARGFEVIDEIKSALEKECPQTVSCADILALAARDSTVLTGGPNWDVLLGRRDSKGSSLRGSNDNIPAPNDTLLSILDKFKQQGLDIVDLVALSDQVLVTNNVSLEIVKKYAANNTLFFEQFAKSMIKMGNISPLTGLMGSEIRKNCRKINA